VACTQEPYIYVAAEKLKKRDFNGTASVLFVLVFLGSHSKEGIYPRIRLNVPWRSPE
jgi:hypothetical protein